MKKPNILLIMTDQHRLSALKAYDKDTVCRTPNIDKLAAEGVLFENAYTTCPVHPC
jgi:arylsulfatase A-like enzyme